MKILIAVLASLASARAGLLQGTDSRTYLPPQQTGANNAYHTPGNTYLPPSDTEMTPYEDNVPNAVYLSSSKDETRSKNEYLPPAILPRPTAGPQNAYLPVATSPRPNNNYLPPVTSSVRPQNAYLPPVSANGGPKNTYLPPVSPNAGPQNAYLPPISSNAGPQNEYLPPVSANARPHNEYLPPVSENAGPQNQYLPPVSANARPQNAYLPPSREYLPVTSKSSDFSFNGQRSKSWSAKSSSAYEHSTKSVSSWSSPRLSSSSPSIPKSNTKWATTALSGFDRVTTNQYGSQSMRYSTGYGYPKPEGMEPAKYEFEYAVKDVESGNDYRHMESRDGETTWGSYSVVLPDGRKQTVEYEADEDGFKPKITYEEPNRGYSGNNRIHPQGPY